MDDSSDKNSKTAADQVKAYYRRCGVVALMLGLFGMAVAGVMAYTFLQATR